jgi:hypothetical protein
MAGGRGNPQPRENMIVALLVKEDFVLMTASNKPSTAHADGCGRTRGLEPGLRHP